MSCDIFPTSLVLLIKEKLIGHCKVSLIPNHPDSCLIESCKKNSKYSDIFIKKIFLLLSSK